MSQALPGTHLCKAHQGNHSHYAQKNCELCQAQAQIERLKELLLRANRALQHTTEFDPVRMDPECDSDHLIIEIKNALNTKTD